MFRTLTRQVVPDTMLWRRLQAQFSRGKPVPDAAPTKIGTLLGPDSVFNDIEITYVFDDAKGVATLVYSEPIWTVTTLGTVSGGRRGMRSTSLFSSTSKMSSPSFSLPAGPPREGGTCAAAERGAKKLVRPARGDAPGARRRDAQGRSFICDLCYSTAGNYYYPNVSTAQAARMIWCERMLQDDPTGVALGRQLVKAIEDTARKGHYNNLSKRLGHELGIWNRGQLVAPGKIGGRRGLTPIPIPTTPLPEWTGYRSSNDFFQTQGIPNGAVAGFFRIHDSGDLNVGPKLSTWKAYLRAWEYTAQQLPWVWFWMPVRTWVNKPMVPELQRASQLPNLVIRASPLFVGASPPKIPGVSGSAVHTGTPDPGWYACPVRPRDTSSCSEQGCRACWIAPNLIPSYSEH